MRGVRFIMKKVLAIVLCLMLLLSAAMAEVVYNAPGEYPIANEIVTIKILAPQDGGQALHRVPQGKSGSA